MAQNNSPKAVVCGKGGRLYDLPYMEACGMEGERFYRLGAGELIKLPHGSELFMLPDRSPVGFDPVSGYFMALDGYFAAAAFISPGYTLCYNTAYKKIKKPKPLPLFAYGALAFYKGALYAAALRVDREERQDIRFMDMNLIRKNAAIYAKLYPQNRLIKHLEGCALTYGCPAAKNFFLSRYEAPLPASPHCNANCIGCISHQPDGGCSVAQPRIRFVPAPDEIAEAALHHIKNVEDPVVSFGQGCEGEPLLAAKTIEKAIRLVRKKTCKGIINMNTNASRPAAVARLFDAGLDSMRVSVNSVREEYYARYYRPRGYAYKDVLESVRSAQKRGGFVSLNYLTMPGFTDLKGEFHTLKKFIDRYGIDMIQWRNLNFDPSDYFRRLKIPAGEGRPLGIRNVINTVKKEYPALMSGYFNPSKGRIGRKIKNLPPLPDYTHASAGSRT